MGCELNASFDGFVMAHELCDMRENHTCYSHATPLPVKKNVNSCLRAAMKIDGKLYFFFFCYPSSFIGKLICFKHAFKVGEEEEEKLSLKTERDVLSVVKSS